MSIKARPTNLHPRPPHIKVSTETKKEELKHTSKSHSCIKTYHKLNSCIKSSTSETHRFDEAPKTKRFGLVKIHVKAIPALRHIVNPIPALHPRGRKPTISSWNCNCKSELTKTKGEGNSRNKCLRPRTHGDEHQPHPRPSPWHSGPSLSPRGSGAKSSPTYVGALGGGKCS